MHLIFLLNNYFTSRLINLVPYLKKKAIHPNQTPCFSEYVVRTYVRMSPRSYDSASNFFPNSFFIKMLCVLVFLPRQIEESRNVVFPHIIPQRNQRIKNNNARSFVCFADCFCDVNIPSTYPSLEIYALGRELKSGLVKLISSANDMSKLIIIPSQLHSYA